MAFVSKIPYKDAEGIEYPFFMVNLIIAPRVDGKNVMACTVVNLTPYRVLEDGNIRAAPDKTAVRSVLMRDAYATAAKDPVTAEAMGHILAGIGKFIDKKGF